MALKLRIFLWLCACAFYAWICICAFMYVGVRNSVAYFYLLFAELFYCFGPSCRPESWKAGCFLRRQRDESARVLIKPAG